MGSDLELFEHFVRNGHLPWWANGDRPRLIHETLVRLIEDAPEALARLLHGLIREDRPLKRLVRQVEDELRPAILGLLAGWSTDAPAALPRVLLAVLREADAASSPATGRDLSAAFWETALATAARSRSVDRLPSTFWVEVLQQVAMRRRIDLLKLVEALRMAAATADGQLRGTLLTTADDLEALIPATASSEVGDEIAGSPREGDGIPSRLMMDSGVVIEKGSIGCHGL